MNNRKVAITTVVILGLIIVGLLAALIFVPAPDRSGTAGPGADWVTYRNDTYNFEIQHPADWIVTVSDEDFEPKINIYKENETAKPPFIHHSQVTHVSIFPKGVGTEGVESDMATSTVKFAEPVQNSIDFFIAGGTPWATYTTFKKIPSSWDSFGFVWAGVKIENPSSDCVVKEESVPMEDCDLGQARKPGAHIVLKGRVDAADRALEERMLATFHFLEESSSPPLVPGPVSVQGELVCLPHKDSGGIQTQECAIGLHGDDSKYYGLVGLVQEDIVSGKWTIGVRAKVSGQLSAMPDSKYAIVGSIAVQKIEPAAAS